MIEDFDKLAITPDNFESLTEEEVKKRIEQREELIKKMTDEEIKELLDRPYPAQYKIKIKELRK